MPSSRNNDDNIVKSRTTGPGGGGGGGGGLSHSNPIRTLNSPTTNMSKVHGSGVGVSVVKNSGGGTSNMSRVTSGDPLFNPSSLSFSTISSQQPRPPPTASLPSPNLSTQLSSRQQQQNQMLQQKQQQMLALQRKQQQQNPYMQSSSTVRAGGAPPPSIPPQQTSSMPNINTNQMFSPPPPPPNRHIGPVSAPLPSSSIPKSSTQTSVNNTAASIPSRRGSKQNNLGQHIRNSASNVHKNSASSSNSTTATASVKKTLEMEAISFMAQGSILQGKMGPAPVVSQEDDAAAPPSPVKSSVASEKEVVGDAVRRVRSLAKRRCWGEVVQLTDELLIDIGSPYHKFYSSLVDFTSSKPTNGEETDAGIMIVNKRMQTETSELISLRLNAMLKLRRYPDLEGEVKRLNLLPPPPSKKVDGDINDTEEHWESCLPDWVPIGLRILGAQTLQYTQQQQNPQHHHQRCIDALHILKNRIKNSSSISTKRWIGRITSTLSNSLLRAKEFRLALSELDYLLEDEVLTFCIEQEVDDLMVALVEKIKTENNNSSDGNFCEDENQMDQTIVRKELVTAISTAARVEICSRQGRMMLQIGALAEGQMLFDAAAKDWALFDGDHNVLSNKQQQNQPSLLATKKLILISKYSLSRLIQQAPAQLLINAGLAKFAHQKYDAAMSFFRKTVEYQRLSIHNSNYPIVTSDVVVHNPSHLDEHSLSPGIGFDTDPSLLTQSLNNMSLCSLYTCEMKKAVQVMESMVRESPTTYLTEGLAFNLCTLYELGSDNTSSARKKKVLQLISKQFNLHDIGVESFRINPRD